MNRLPTELKKLKGTINTTREKRNPAADVVLKNTGLIFDATTSVKCPKELTDPYCKKYYKKITESLLEVGVLSPLDIPYITRYCVIIQKMRETDKLLSEMDPLDDDYERIFARSMRLVSAFTQMSAKVYVTPMERQKIRLDELNIREKEVNLLEKQEDAIAAVLAQRG